MLVEIDTADVEDLVAVDQAAALVHRKATVGVAVVGEPHVEALLDHMAAQAVDVRGAAVDVDVEAVGRVVDHAHVGAERVEHGLGNRARRAVRAVETHLDALEREVGARDEERDVAVAALHVVDRAADLVARGERHLAGAVDVALDQLEHVVLHLVAVGVHELDAVVGIGVVARADHDAAVKAAVHGLVGHAGRGDHVQQVGVGTTRHQAAHQRRFEHVARAARVFAHDHAGLLARACTVIPPHIAPDLERMLDGEVAVGLAAESVGAEVLHSEILSGARGARRRRKDGPAPVVPAARAGGRQRYDTYPIP